MSGCPLAHDSYPEPPSACGTDDECFPGEVCGNEGLCVVGPKLGCDPDFGRTYIFSRLEILPEDQGFDLTGDGLIDNHMASSPQLVALVNNGFIESITNGDTVFLMDILDWTDPPTADDSSVTMAIYSGRDADRPVDPSNNVTGDGEFLIPVAELDVNCAPMSKSDYASITGRVLEAGGERAELPVGGLGTIGVNHASVIFTFNEDFSGGSGMMGAIMTLCSLSRIPYPGKTEGSVLAAVAAIGVMPDIDRDGDGIEQVVVEGTGVVECIDGDGTHIPGADCTCNARIVDGYSVTFGGTAVPARILGVSYE